MGSVWSIWEMINVTVLVPQWYLWAIGLCGIIVSLLAFLLVSWISYKRSTLRLQVAGNPVKKVEKIISPKDINKTSTESKHIQSASPAESTSSVPTAISGIQLQDLTHRVEIGGGFLVADASSLLKESQGKIVKRVRAGDLVSYRDQTNRLWVSAQSIADLLGLTRQEGAAGVTSSVVANEEKELAAKPVVVEREASASSYKPVPPIRQHYWYYVGNEATGYKTLAEILSVIGYTGTAEWGRLPKDVQNRIRREHV